jgi:glycosyltransferase involved in cell wall biosynthesis
MKLLYITETFGNLTETFIGDLVDALAQQLDSVTVVANFVKNEAVPHNVELRAIPFRYHRMRRIDRMLQSSALGRFGPMNRCANALSKPKMEAVLKEVQPEIAIIDFGHNTMPIATILHQRKIPFLVHFHATDITSMLKDDFYRRNLRTVFETAKALVAPSENIRRLLIIAGAPSEKCHKVSLGISAPAVPLEWKQRLSSPPTLCFLGRFVGKKQPIALAEMLRLVVQNVPNCRLVAIGSGPLVKNFQARIEKYGLEDNVEYSEGMPRELAMKKLNEAWIYVQHSVTDMHGDQEGWPVVIGEACRLGLPIVSTAHSGIREQVEDGKNGYLVPEYDFELMAERVVSLISAPNLLMEMGEVSRMRVRCFTHEKRARRLLELLVA